MGRKRGARVSGDGSGRRCATGTRSAPLPRMPRSRQRHIFEKSALLPATTSTIFLGGTWARSTKHPQVLDPWAYPRPPLILDLASLSPPHFRTSLAVWCSCRYVPFDR